MTQYASDMNVLLSYHNLLDDWQDEKNYPKHVMSMMLKKDYARISQQISATGRGSGSLHEKTEYAGA